MQTDNVNRTIEHMPLFSQRTRYYEIETKIELVDMARIFFNDTGRVLFFLCFAIYLYGDLSIYAAAVAKTMRDVIWYANRVCCLPNTIPILSNIKLAN